MYNRFYISGGKISRLLKIFYAQSQFPFSFSDGEKFVNFRFRYNFSPVCFAIMDKQTTQFFVY